MKKIVFLLGIFIFLLFSCSKQKKRVMFAKTTVETFMDISYVDQYGNDLLNPDNPLSYNVDNFRLYYMKNGKKTLYFQANMDDPYGYMKAVYYPDSGLYRFRIFPPADFFYLQLSTNEIDTITSPFQYEDNGSLITIPKFWYNGRLVWKSGTYRYIIIHKQRE